MQRPAAPPVLRAERARRALSGCNRALVTASDEARLFDAVCTLLVDICGYRLAWIGAARDDADRTVAQVARFGPASGYLDTIAVTWGAGAHGRGPTGSSLRTGKVVCLRDTAGDARFAPWRAQALRYGLGSVAALPFGPTDMPSHVLTVYADVPDAFDADELELLTEISQDLGFGMGHLHVRQEQERLATAIAHVAESIVITDLHGRIEWVNPAFERVTGYSREEAIGRNPRFLSSGEQSPALHRAMWATLTSNRAWHGEFVNRRKNGSRLVEEASIVPVHDGAGRVVSFVGVKRDVTAARALAARVEAAELERATIRAAIANLAVGRTAEETATALCERALTMPSVAMAAVAVFVAGYRLRVLAAVSRLDASLTVASSTDLAARGAGLRRRVEELRDLLASGPAITPIDVWAGHPIAAAFAQAGVTAVASVPVHIAGELTGLIVAGATGPAGDRALAADLNALGEFGALASVLLGHQLGDIREADARRRFLQRVIDGRRFAPVFQPIVDLQAGRTVGVEALTRFTDGASVAGRFAEAAALGIGPDLEVATLDAAVAAAAFLPEGMWLDLNVSPALFVDAERLAHVCRAARRPLVLELTEHEAIADYGAIRASLSEFGVPVRLAVDDAGAGFASLRHILELQPDFIKLDKVLVTNIDGDAARQGLVAGLTHFARIAGCQIVAEGIEVPAEYATLLALDVPLGQGYLLGRPVPIASFVASHRSGRGAFPLAG